MTNNVIHIIRFRPQRYGPPPEPAPDFLLLENGDFLLTETDDKIILENE